MSSSRKLFDQRAYAAAIRQPHHKTRTNFLGGMRLEEIFDRKIGLRVESVDERSYVFARRHVAACRDYSHVSVNFLIACIEDIHASDEQIFAGQTLFDLGQEIF